MSSSTRLRGILSSIHYAWCPVTPTYISPHWISSIPTGEKLQYGVGVNSLLSLLHSSPYMQIPLKTLFNVECSELFIKGILCMLFSRSSPFCSTFVRFICGKAHPYHLPSFIASCELDQHILISLPVRTDRTFLPIFRLFPGFCNSACASVNISIETSQEYFRPHTWEWDCWVESFQQLQCYCRILKRLLVTPSPSTLPSPPAGSVWATHGTE